MEIEGEDIDFLHKWRKYMLLLAILVATVTYVAGLNPPGGVDFTGEAVLPSTYPRRYDIFFHCNAMAFMASLAVILLLLDQSVSSSTTGLAALRSAMVLVLLGLLGAYAAGSCREVVTSFYVSVLAAAVSAFIVVHITVSSLIALLPPETWTPIIPKRLQKEMKKALEREPDALQKQRGKFVMLLATFVTSLTYGAGLSPPGGFWPESNADHRAGDAVLRESNLSRFRTFFVCNATAFVASVAIITLLLSRRLSGFMSRSKVLGFIVLLQLFGLIGAYAAGSGRAVHTTVVSISLIGLVLVFVVGFEIAQTGSPKQWLDLFRTPQPEQSQTNEAQQVHRELEPTSSTPTALGASPGSASATASNGDQHLENLRSLLLLLATLSATVTYQAGLTPPGGVWPDNGNPILADTHSTRYKMFFYFNATAFMASLLVIIIAVQSKKLISTHRYVLLEVMILDLLGLAGAYIVGSCRDVETSLCVLALAVAVFVYVVIHVVAYNTLPSEYWNCLRHMRDTVHSHLNDGNQSKIKKDDVEKKRKFLLMLAILAATITYQAGLTPPGGFWSDNAKSHHAGDPILVDRYPQRYKLFFYCNATGFMASVATIILLVSGGLYKQGIRCYALRVCMVIGILGLMGAYTAGSCRTVKTSIYVFALVGVVLVFVAIHTILFVFLHVRCGRRSNNLADVRSAPQGNISEDTEQVHQGNISEDIEQVQEGNGSEDIEQVRRANSSMEIEEVRRAKSFRDIGHVWRGNSSMDTEEVRRVKSCRDIGQMRPSNSSGDTEQDIERKRKRKQLMLLGILAASVTYQAGLSPPGGVWTDNNGHVAGNPVLRDTDKHRYQAFYYCNATSFMASIVVVILVLLRTIRPNDLPHGAMRTAMVLDMLGLLGAYGAGSSRKGATSAYVVTSVVVVIVAFVAYMFVSYRSSKMKGALVLPCCGGSSDQ